MGDTKEIQLHRGLKFARLISAAITGLFFAVAMVQLFMFPNIRITFNTGTDAQPITSMKIKKGANVELPTPLKPGSYFLGWSLSPNSAEILEDSTGLLKDTTLYAVWDGAEKYAVLSVNGIPYSEVNIFDTSVEGLTPAELTADWRVLDDYAIDNPNRAPYTITSNQTTWADPNNNFSRFLGWQYLNAYGRYNDLLYEPVTTDPNTTEVVGKWTLVERDADGKETRTAITNTHKFYPPNYRTTFTALLDYRAMHIQFYDQAVGGNEIYTTIDAKLGEAVTLPVFGSDTTKHFSHWELQVGKFKKYVNPDEQPELAALVNQVAKRYEAGEILTALDPMWYYYGLDLMPLDGITSNLVVTINLRAVYWDDPGVYKYSIRPFTDVDSGTKYLDFSGVDELTLENPVLYNETENCLWLRYDNQILSYTFYDHNGVYHELTSYNMREDIGIGLGRVASVLGQSIYFNNDWAITIAVNYQTSATKITVKFNYGDDLYLLPNYRYFKTTTPTTRTSEIGSTFVFPTGESYMKYDYIFTGWKLVGDDSGRIYCAGESFKIPNFNILEHDTTIEFEAVWHLQRLLFNFNFMGGEWPTKEGPDFTLMKGAYREKVRLVSDIPVKFGYDFIGWTVEKSTYDDESELLQPGSDINVGTKMQTLYAQWKPRRLRVVFWAKLGNNISEDEEPSPAKAPVTVDAITGEVLYAGGYVALPYISDSKYYTFHGWVIGGTTKPANTNLQLTTQTLKQIKDEREASIVDSMDDYGAIMDVYIYADQARRTVDVDYNLEAYAMGVGTVNLNVNLSDFDTKLLQGARFYEYYPFNAKDYAIFDTAGCQFKNWVYLDSRGDEVAITYETRIPSGQSIITIKGVLDQRKNIKVEFYNAEGVVVDEKTSYYSNSIELIDSNDSNRLPSTYTDTAGNEWGTFVGWALEPDFANGNPEFFYDLYNKESSGKMRLFMLNTTDASGAQYSIDIDTWAKHDKGLDYVLKLYAVYATDYVTIKYNYLNQGTSRDTELKLPVFGGKENQFDQTVVGGSTVGDDSDDFLGQGLVVLDDSTLQSYSSMNFVGWKVKALGNNVNPTVRAYFENKIWFPGEYLPTLNFSFEFEPIRVEYNTEPEIIHVGDAATGRDYRVLSLANGQAKFEYNGSVDIVALPRGTYTVKQGGIIITSDREVHVVVPSDSPITLEPRAIQCNTIKEFYVGDKLLVSGSPVVGDNFQTYRIRKGYRLLDTDRQITDVQGASEKYNFAASMSGLLIGHDEDDIVLYGVPSHTTLTANDLLDLLQQYSITRIAGYALSDLNLSIINLAIKINGEQKLRLDANAIFNATANQIILPTTTTYTSNLSVDPQVLSGALSNLAVVTFGDTTTVRTWYAFVDRGFVYYIDNRAQPETKTHVMYVLRTAELENLLYTSRNLRFPDTVTKIEPYALMGRDWTEINSIMAENPQVDLTKLQGIPDIPIFASADNIYNLDHSDPRIQPYYKTFIFTCNDSVSGYYRVELKFAYGQTFTVFSAQKNNYSFYFDKTFAQFYYWKFNGEKFYPGDVRRVGFSEDIIGDKYTMQFDASSSECWRYYPVQFYVYDSATNDNVAYTPDVFYDAEGHSYTMDELLTYKDFLGEIYLPGYNQTFTTADGSVYQFIGWGTNPTSPRSLNTLMWNNAAMQDRILPNHTANTELDAGLISYTVTYPEGTVNIYRYYALYEKVTPHLLTEMLGDNTFAITGLNDYGVSSLNIPFAIYHAGYMYPVSKINNNAFSAVNTNKTLTEIAIGGAVSEIGQGAFNGVNANQIKFAHSGRGIYYNYRQSTPVYQLTIRDYAFANNIKIQNLVLPLALETLGAGVFQSCIELKEVTFEEGKTWSSALRNIGDFVFRDNQSMTNNAVVSLLSDDGKVTENNKNGDNRFLTVGDGIFMNTKLSNLTSNKIVWRDKLLHVVYTNGNKTMVFYEKEIAGYAFVNAGDNNLTTNVSIRFSNANVHICSNAFTYLNASISKIYMNTSNAAVKIGNIEADAFGPTDNHYVDVYVNNFQTWTEKFKDVYKNGNGYFRFVYAS